VNAKRKKVLSMLGSNIENGSDLQGGPGVGVLPFYFDI
jgi:hypothetical protein